VRRRKILESFLRESSDRQRQLGLALQREIDVRRKMAEDWQTAFFVIAGMMCEQLLFLGEELACLRDDMRVAVPGKSCSGPTPAVF